MTASDDLWTAVTVSYSTEGLVQLSNINDPAATAINTFVGRDAAQAAINYWPIYAQSEYDETNALHVEIGKRAAIAVLYERGGSSTQIAKTKWDEVFSKGIVDALKNTEARGRQAPVIDGPAIMTDGTQRAPWSSRDSLPYGLMPEERGLRDTL